MSASPSNIENVLDESLADKGYVEDIFISTSDLRIDASAWTILAGTGTTPDLITVGTGAVVHGFKFDHGDGTSHRATVSFAMPRQYANLQKHFTVVMQARKVDATADENSDLKLQCHVDWINPGSTTEHTLTTPPEVTLDAVNTAAANTNLIGFAEYEFDIGACLVAESKEIKAGAAVRIRIGPNETVGSTDMDVECLPPILSIRRHARAQE